MSTRKRAVVGPSIPVDRTIKGVGRIRHASGLHARAQFAVLQEAITELARTPEGRQTLALMTGKKPRLRGDGLYLHYRNKTLHLLKLGSAAVALVPALTRWREEMKRDVAPDTYRTRNELITKVTAVARDGALVSELPDCMRLLRVQMKGARQFNYCLDYARAFLRDTLGRRNDLYLDVADIQKRKVTPKVRKRPLSPVEVLAIARAFDVVRAQRIATSTAKRGVRPIEATGDDAIVMALTGMNPKEHAGEWAVFAHHLHIDGTKVGGRDRDIPKAFPNALWPHAVLPRPSVSPKTFWRHFGAAASLAGIRCTPYDLRRTFANWMEAAKIERSRRVQYLGHGAKDTTDKYERHEVTAHLSRDAEILRDWINAQLAEQAPKP